MLYEQAGIPTSIARIRIGEKALPTFVGSPSSRKAIEISEKIIGEIDPNFNIKQIYVDSCMHRHSYKKTA